jgi:hypothetical protein
MVTCHVQQSDVVALNRPAMLRLLSQLSEIRRRYKVRVVASAMSSNNIYEVGVSR